MIVTVGTTGVCEASLQCVAPQVLAEGWAEGYGTREASLQCVACLLAPAW